MRVRVRFSKQGNMKFVGHLDMVRYFQKVMRRANVDVCYTEGFSPHQKISFAAPLSVGVTSNGEYFDMEVNSTNSSKLMIQQINDHNVSGIQILSYKLLPENAKNAMSIVAAADYYVYTDLFSKDNIDKFIAQNEINILKKTKKSEKIVNIKELLYEITWYNDKLFLKVAQGSANNLKPELVIEALALFCDITLPEFLQYERLDMYCFENEKLVSLDEIGGIIEQ